LVVVNEKKLAELEPSQSIVRLCQWEDLEAELDEMWSFVNSKKEQRWLWHAINHDTGEILAYVLSGHKDEAFVRLKELLEPFGITQYYTDGWGHTNDILSQHCIVWVSIIPKKSNEST